jgi:hypothetical protein
MQALFSGQSPSTAMSQLATQIDTQLNSKTN